jgi:hypothetical protein
MSQISEALQQGFLNYYKTITGLGQVDLNKVHKLIIASWINDVLEGKYGFLVSDEQYSLLDHLYPCVEGNCLVPYQKYCNDVVINKLPDNRYVRMTEVLVDNSTERILEASNNLRMI